MAKDIEKEIRARYVEFLLQYAYYIDKATSGEKIHLENNIMQLRWVLSLFEKEERRGK